MAQARQRPGADAESGPPGPIEGGVGASILRPHNVPSERAKSDRLAAPSADAD